MEAVRASRSHGSTIPNVLSIAGSDPSGGAGIQADIKSISAMGGYALAVVTALTAQNTTGVTGVHTPPVEFLRRQLDAVSEDVALDAVKIGMLGSADTARCVTRWLDDVRPAAVVLDPVMIATSGARLLDDDAVLAVLDLATRASLVTPNLPELAVLVGAEPAASWQEALRQGCALATASGTRVLVKGGHLPGEGCPDALVAPGDAPGDVTVFDGPRVATANTHGTGCSLASAIAARYALTGDWPTAISDAKSWLEGALRAADRLDVGRGSGPVHHFHAHHFDTVASAGPRFTDLAWEDTATIRRDILELPFVRALGEGTLPADHFAYYLQQDALYLREYTGILARVAALAPSEDEQLFWLAAATSCLQTEAELHRTWLTRETGTRFGEGGTGPVTRAYCDHLAASAVRGSYAELVAAVLPCFWLYAFVGDRVQARSREDGRQGADHPYAGWIDTYADPGFAAATVEAKRLADIAYRQASVRERDAMITAFRWSSGYEREFFDAARVRGPGSAAHEAPDLRERAVLP